MRYNSAPVLLAFDCPAPGRRVQGAQVNGFLLSEEPCLWCDDGNRSLRSSREERGRAHPLRGASTSSRWWLATLLKIVLSCFDLLVRELQSDFTSSGTLQGPGVFVMCG